MHPSFRLRAWLAPASALALTVAFSVVPAGPAQAAACVPTSDVVTGGYRIVQFKTTGSCTWDLGASRDVEVLIVGGGGAGASSPLNVLGGGGAGGVAAGTITVGGELTIVVGAGGAKETSCGNHTDGQASSLTGPGGSIFVQADGGGRGAGCSMGGDGTNGGSGAGAHPWNGDHLGGTATKGLVTGTTGITLYGNAGASALYGQGGGGGGGAGTAAAAVTGTAGGDGGEGMKSSITGTEVTYASGGGGSGTSGGRGGTNAGNGAGSATAATAGVNGTGSGGGGGGDGTGGGAAGGSGIVVLKYLPDCSPTSSTVGDDTVWQFTTVEVCVWAPPSSVSFIDVLVVGGGGGGGAIAAGGGGGAGGVLFGSRLAAPSGVIVEVGAGGAAGLLTGVCRGGTGGDSFFGGAVALGGGGGGCYNTAESPDRNASVGGSGGGHGEVAIARSGAPSTQTAPSGYQSFGNAGGSVDTFVEGGSGGGGAGAAGKSPVAVAGPDVPGDGGDGKAFDITGSSTYYAGGGGGGAWSSPGVTGGVGGQGGGGSGGGPTSGSLPTAGQANSGGGGGGSGYPAGALSEGAAGGSGIVIVRSRPAVTSFAVSAASAGNGSAAASPTSVSSGGSATLTATANTGYAFSSWSCMGGGSLSASTDNPATLSNITADASCTASFSKVPDPQTISVTTAAPGSAAYGATFPVAATSGSGLAVAITTSGACSGSGTGSATVTMSSSSGSCTVAFNQPGNSDYAAAPELTQSVTATKVATTVTYTGDRVVVLPASLKLSAQTTGAAFCTAVGYKLDRNPTTNGGEYTLTPTSGSVSTSGWGEGVYELTVTYGGDANCSIASDTATITVAAAGAAASAGGFYTLGGAGRVSVGMTVRAVPKTTPTQYRGQILLINNGKWRLKGTVTTYGKSGSMGTIAGTGSLQWWDQTFNGGLGAWVVVASTATYSATMTATTKSSPGSFGVTIVYTPVAPQGGLPNSPAQLLKGGRINLA